MLIDFINFSVTFAWLCNFIAMVLVFAAIIKAPWKAILEVSERQHLVLASILGLIVFWLMDFSITEQITIHPLVVTCITLMIGLRLTLAVGFISSLAYLLIIDVSIINLGSHFLINVALPALFITMMIYFLNKAKPANLFFYTLGIGFLGSALTIPLVATISYFLLWVLDPAFASAQSEWHLHWLLLAMFPEAFINGAIVSSITVFYPHWMKSFDEDYFLSK